MIFELGKNNYYKVKDMFNELNYNLSIYSTINNLNPGKIFVNDENNPTVAMIISVEGIFLGGNLENDNFFRELNKKLKYEGFKNITKSKNVEYLIFYPSPEWEDKVKLMLESYNPIKDKRRYLQLEIDRYEIKEVSLNVRKVDKVLLQSNNLEGLEDIKENIIECYGSFDKFYNNGFGFIYVLNNQIISWCLSDCIVEDRAEVGVETEEEHRRNGYCTEVVLAALNYCKNNNIKTIGWHCWEDNVGSYKLAESVGFTQRKDITMYFGWYDQIVNYLINGNHYMKTEINYELAAKFYTMAFEHNYGHPWQYYNAACAYERIGQSELAKKYYDIAKEYGFEITEDLKNSPLYKYIYSEDDVELINK